MEHEIKFESYSTEQLFDALEGVDDIKYRDNALRIYQLLLKKRNLKHQQATPELLGYQDQSAFKTWFLSLLPIVSWFNDDQQKLNQIMRDKLQRLKAILDEVQDHSNP